ncbi:histone H1 [Sugiyamaella lignohabitans]|uniref:Histone H1 n=1 Tax=Sugiyamaella lignohabitans TaxID=796027 RepID=A0A167BXJ8_9ASCO|nr:histone H1 [Sugiyamaella lignohabitans]ANB10949.1 histone H1 [Sugiyamaella lignohabitans]
MVKDAILQLKERSGSSRQAIKKYIQSTHSISAANFDSLLNAAIRKGVVSGDFVQPKGPSGPVKLQKKEVVKPAKKPVAKKTETKPAAKAKAKTTTKPKTVAKKPAAKKTEKKPAVKATKAKATASKVKKAAPKKKATATKAK